MIYEADQGLEYHIKVNEDMIGQYVIMPGDPKRCKAIAAYLEDAELVRTAGNLSRIQAIWMERRSVSRPQV